MLKFDEAGCGKKLGYQNLERALKPLASLTGIGADSGAIFGADNLVMSIDTGFLIGSDLEAFGRLAVLHSLGDIHASHATGIGCAISVNLGESAVPSFEVLMRGVIHAARAESMPITKGHTTQGGLTNITCSIVGRKLRLSNTDSHSSLSSVFLTRPLGAARLLKLATIEEDDIGVARALRSMERSHKLLLEHDASNAVTYSDVSGFGLAGSLVLLSKTTCHRFFVINLSALKRIDVDYELIPTTCDYTQNKLDFENFVRPDVFTEIDNLNIFGQEYCGPLVCIVPMSEEISFFNAALERGFDLIKIGVAENRDTPNIIEFFHE
jgi:thiamine monophosphate kinase